MHFTNPFTNPPRLPSPSKRRPHSRSPSHSPIRYRAGDNDPLLRDLSPSSTLRAFVSDPNEWTENTSNALVRSILTSSHSERALGAKAAQVCLDVRSWTREMEHWQWPGTFEVPERARKRARTSTLSFGTIASIIPDDDEEEEYWGSLPAKTVQAYGLRADEIGQALDQIDVEELKDFVLSSHYRPGSRSTDRGKRNNLKQLDDYTAVITATILQALPYLSRLNRLLDLWTIRLIILQGATVFVRDLQRARMDMDHGWAAIAVSSASGNNPTSASFGRETMLEMKQLIEQQVGSLGRRLDRFLDDLEGREETVPDAWIEDFERLETAYGDWVVQAERKVLENEWREIQEKTTMTRADEPEPVRSLQQGEYDVSHTENPDSDGEAVVRPSIDRSVQSVLPSELDTDGDINPARRGSQRLNADGTGTEWQADSLLPRKSLSDERKSRNVPSVSSSTGPDTAPVIGRSRSQGNQPISDASPDPAPLARSRTAFLNSVDRTNTLMKQSKTPVRPFEHASNAFTRLFKKDRSPEQVKAIAAKFETEDNGFNVQKDDRSSVRGRKPFPAVLNVGRRTKSANMDSYKKAGSARNLFGLDNTSNAGDIPSIPLLMPPKDIQRQRFTPEDPRVNVQTESTLSSPFHSPKHAQFPEDWPLSTQDSPQRSPDADLASHAIRAKSEIYTSAIPLETDAFDQMFVQNFPGTSSARPSSAREAREPAPWSEGHRRAKSMPRVKGKSPANIFKSRESKQTSTFLPNRTPLDSIVVPDPDTLRPVSMVAEVTSSLQPKSEVSPALEPSVSEGSSTPIDLHPALEAVDSAQSEMSAPLLTQVPVKADLLSGADEYDITEQSNDGVLEPEESEIERPNLLKRASVTSVEAFKRTDVKSIDVPSSSKPPIRSSPAGSLPHTPEVSRPGSPIVMLPEISNSTPASHKSTLMLPTPPRNSSLGKATVSARPETPTSRHRDTLPSSPLDDRRENTPEGRVAPLNAAMTKRRGKVVKKRESHGPGVLTLSPSKKGAIFNPEGDSFDRHISEVLETLPSSIRFKTRPGAETPVSDVGEARTHGAPRARTARVPPRHNVTIAPAESPPKRSSATSDNEVKVYHLTQAGSDETIKLFVRLVGESERVMVRVGGGWADLADYLRQYAEHHGSRTVSQGTLEFQSVNGTASRRVSAAAEQKGKQPVTPNANQNPGSDDPNWLNHSQTRFSMGDSTSSDEGDSGVTSRLTASVKTTPLSTNGSRPSTANTERPSSRQSVSDAKLSGPPSGKRANLSEHKEKWVEGMIERAKQASAEKTKEENQKYFAELGKAGATRRVIFRSSSAMSNRPNGSDKSK